MNHQKTLLCISMALALSACGDSSSVVSSSTAKAVDGYLSGSTVVCDTDNNGVLSTGEAHTTTNATGDFTFSPACASTIVVSGGTNMDTGLAFKGLLKAPAGSTVATPLTSLMVSSNLTAAQVATAMGLPAGTDVTKTDPMATGNLELRKRTVALQAIVQQIADTLGGLAGDTTTTSIQAIYSQVAKTVAATIIANSSTLLISSTGVVDVELVETAVKDSVTTLQTTGATALTSSAQTAINLFSGASVSALIASSVQNQAQSLAMSADASTLVTAATALQSNNAIATTATISKDLLTTANYSSANLVNLATVATSLIALSDSSSTNDAAAATTLSTTVTAAATAAGVTPPVIPANIAGNANALSIHLDQLSFARASSPLQTATLTQFKSTSGVTLFGLPDSVSFAYDIKGVPIPTGGSTVSIGLEIAQASSNRVLQVILDRVNLTLSGSTVTATVPADAKLYTYGKRTDGSKANWTLTNTAANALVAVSGSQLTFNAKNVLDGLIAKDPTLFNSLLNVSGSFTMKIVISNLAIESGTTGAVESLSMSVTSATGASPIYSMSGLGVSGYFTLQ